MTSYLITSAILVIESLRLSLNNTTCLCQLEQAGLSYGNRQDHWRLKYALLDNNDWMFLTNNVQTETLFHTYSQFAAVSNIPPKPTEDEKQTESKVQDLLEKVYQYIQLA